MAALLHVDSVRLFQASAQSFSLQTAYLQCLTFINIKKENIVEVVEFIMRSNSRTHSVLWICDKHLYDGAFDFGFVTRIHTKIVVQVT